MRFRSATAAAVALAIVATLISGAAAERPGLLPPAGDAPRSGTRMATTQQLTQGTQQALRIHLNPITMRADTQEAYQPGGAVVAVASTSSGYPFRSEQGLYAAQFPAGASGSIRLEKGVFWLEMGSSAGDVAAVGGGPSAASHRPPGQPQAPPRLEQNSIRYADPGSGVAVEYTVEPTYLKQVMVLETPRSALTLRLPLSFSPELTAHAENGRVFIWRRDFPGLPIFILEPIQLKDARGAVSPAVAPELVPSGERHLLSFSADPAWLTAPDRAWPLRIETIANVSFDANWRTIRLAEPEQPAQPPWSASAAAIIQKDGGNDDRLLMRFDLRALAQQKVGRVHSAVLRSYTTPYNGYASSLALSTLGREWTLGRVSWKYADVDAKAPWAAPGGDVQRTLATFPSGDFNLDITDAVRAWVTGEPHYGLMMACANSPCMVGLRPGLIWIDITYDPDPAPPTAAVTAPSSGAVISGNTSVTATATDNYGVQRVELLVDGAVVASAGTAPYRFNLDSTGYARGGHTLAVRAWDQAGNTALSPPVEVTFTAGLAAVEPPTTGPDPNVPQPPVTAFVPLGPEELGLDRRWGYQPLPAPGAYVSLRNGNLVVAATDAVLPAPGLAITFRRTYNSLDTRALAFGRGWQPNFGQRIDDHGAIALWHRADGSSVRFTRASGGTYQPEAGVYEVLSGDSGGGWELTRKDGIVSRFDAGGALERIHDRNGNRISYQTGTGDRTEVTDGVGRRSTVYHRAGTRQVERIEDGAGRTFTYAYDGRGRLIRVAGPDHYSFHYGYHDGTGLLTSITDPVGRRWRFDYDTNGRLTGVQEPGGQWTRIRYE